MVLFPLWDLDLIQASDPPFRRKVVGPRSNSVVHHCQVLAGGEIGSLARVDYFFCAASLENSLGTSTRKIGWGAVHLAVIVLSHATLNICQLVICDDV